MHMIRFASVALVATLVCCCSARAGDWFFEEFFEPYRQRIDAITPSAGNAKHVNGVTHIIDPWPRYVGDRRIPANGARMVGAAERYRDPRKLREAPPSLSSDASSQSPTSSGTNTTSPAAVVPTGR